MTRFSKLAALAAAAAVLAPAAGATPSQGLTQRGLDAYGKTLQAEAVAYRSAGMTQAGLDAYGKTLQAEARAYRASATTVTTAAGHSFSWRDAGLGAAFALAVVVLAGAIVTGRARRGLVAAVK
jgi:hypothetical protein